MLENIGIGIDIVDVNRFRKISYISKKKFYEKNFSSTEIKYCLSFNNTAIHFAGKFAAKEAVKKSICEPIDIGDIEVVNDSSVPKIKLKKKFPYRFKVSITHENDFAIAIVISEKNRKLK